MRDVTASGGERRWTAVVMADMAGSTAVTEQIGAEKAYQLLTRLIAMAVRAVEDEGGTALTFGGDSLLASFGAPVAVEDASLRACRAALAFQAAIATETEALEQQFGIRPQFRIGISGGMVVVGPMGPNAGMDLNIMGQPVNTASRLQELAEPGQILLSDAMFGQVEGEVEFTDLGPHSLKGISGRPHVFALHNTLDASARFAGRIRRGLVDMVGRRDHLRALHRGLAQAVPGWHLLLVKGPPGIGKSRLLHDFRLSMQGEREVFQGQCRAGTHAPYQPIADILIAASKVAPSDGTDAVLDGLRGLLGDDLALDTLRHVLSPGKDMLASNADSNLALAVRETLRKVLTRLFDRQPCVLVIEDAHWIDGSSRNVIEELLRAGPMQDRTCPLLMTTRPEGAPQWAAFKPTQTLSLASLTEAESGDLASRRLRNARLSAPLAKLLFEKSEGNPLFIEEISRYLGSADALEETTAGLAIRPGAGSDLASGNLQHLIMARVDALSAPLRQTLRFAAVQGRQFSQDVLKAVEPGSNLDAQLAKAADRGLIEPEPGGDAAQWRFRHALLRDAIYGSLLEDSRRPLHAVIGHAIETLNKDRPEEVCEALAYHFDAAGRPALAAPYLIRSAQKALQVYDLDEVDRLSLRLRDILRDDPTVISQPDLDRMIVVWLEAMNFKGHFARAIEVAAEFLPHLRKGGDGRAIEIAVSHYATALTHARDYKQAIDLALDGIAQANSRGDAMSAAWLQLPLLRAYEETSSLSHADFIALSQKALMQAEALGETRLQMQILYLQGAEYRSQGKVRKSRERNEALQAFAIASNDKRGQGFAAWTTALLYQVAEENEKAVALAEEAMPLTLHGTADAHVITSIWAANVVLGANPHTARARLDETMALARTFEDYNIVQGLGLIDAIYHLRLGKVTEGWSRLCSVLEDTHKGGNVVFSRYFHLVRAEILMLLSGRMKELPPSPDLPDRKVKPPPKPGLGDIATVIKLRLQARRIATADLAYFRARFHSDGTGVMEARALTCESLLLRNKDARAAGLRRAAAMAEAEGMTLLQRRIMAQL